MFLIPSLLGILCLCSAQRSTIYYDRPTFQSSTNFSFHDGGNASYAFDTSSYTCSSTLSEVYPWWYVDLEDIYVIDYINTYYQYDYLGLLEASVNGTAIHVSSNTPTLFSSDTICGKILLENSYQRSFTVYCRPRLSGGYISFHRNTGRSDPLYLCRVRIHGALLSNIPVVNCPADITVSTSNRDIPINWETPIVTDNEEDFLSADCAPPAGASFDVGNTTVTCTAKDKYGDQDFCSFNVQVISDINEPIIVCPDINVNTKTDYATVTWDDPVVVDDVDTGLITTCNPSSGSLIAVGSTEVTCGANDGAGNYGTCTFVVNVYDSSSVDAFQTVTLTICVIILIVVVVFFFIYCRNYNVHTSKLQQLSGTSNMSKIGSRVQSEEAEERYENFIASSKPPPKVISNIAIEDQEVYDIPDVNYRI